MFDVINEINWLAVALATLAYFILGAIWFTPLFGKAYDKGTGIKRSPKQKWPAMYYIGPFLSSLAVTVAAAILLYALHVQNISEAVILGLIIGMGLASISISNAYATASGVRCGCRRLSLGECCTCGGNFVFDERVNPYSALAEWREGGREGGRV